jgi:hypothetical protein
MNIEKSLDIIKGKLLMIKRLLEEDEETEHSSAYEMQKEDFNAIETLLTAYEEEKKKNKKNSEWITNLSKENDKLHKLVSIYQEKNKEYYTGIRNLISQIESAIDFMKTDKSKTKVNMYKQKEEDLKLEIVHLKTRLKEE